MQTLLVDDHTLLLEALATLVNDAEGFELTQLATTVKEALGILNKQPVDLLVTDYNLPDGNGLTLVREARKIYPKLKVIVLSMHDEPHLVKEILKEKVQGYILKSDSQTELLQALAAVKNNKMYLSSDINAMLVQSLTNPEPVQLLSNREREVLKLIIEEHSNKQISDILFISEYTVETHRKNIFRKTQCSSIVGLVKFAYANNLV